MCNREHLLRDMESISCAVFTVDWLFTICSNVPVVTRCTSTSSSMLFQCSRPSEMTDKCWGRSLTTRWRRTMPITTPYSVWRGKVACFVSKPGDGWGAARTEGDVAQSLKDVPDLNPSFSPSLFPPLSSHPGWIHVPTTARVAASVTWGTPLVRCTASVKPTGRGKPVTSHTAWLSVDTLTEVNARARPASARANGKVGWCFGCQWSHCFVHRDGLNNHSVIGFASAGPHMPNPPPWLK